MARFPEYACEYSKRLAQKSRRFALQVYDPKGRRAVECPGGAYEEDPFGELSHASKVKGLKQRFPDRVLVMTTDRCFMNCRHCTRQWLFGRTATVKTASDLARCVEYVKAHPKVRDILLSGGDPMTLCDADLMRFVDAFTSLPSVDMVRVCTRAPCTNPSRVTVRIARLLGRSKKVWVNTQFNCADELTEEARAAAARLVDAGVPVGCQTVLLKGVNDSPAEMLKLLRALTAARIRPYYVFMCDPIAGIDRFRVPRERAVEIERVCAESIGGLSLPRFVMDIPGARRKIPIM